MIGLFTKWDPAATDFELPESNMRFVQSKSALCLCLLALAILGAMFRTTPSAIGVNGTEVRRASEISQSSAVESLDVWTRRSFDDSLILIR